MAGLLVFMAGTVAVIYYCVAYVIDRMHNNATAQPFQRTSEKNGSSVPATWVEVLCPYCGSSSIMASKRGYKLWRGLFWALVLGFFNFWLGAIPGALIGMAIGLAIGNIGSHKVQITCLNCGKRFKPGKSNKKSN